MVVAAATAAAAAVVADAIAGNSPLRTTARFEQEKRHSNVAFFLRATDGALFTGSDCLGVYAPKWEKEKPIRRWYEVALLSS